MGLFSWIRSVLVGRFLMDLDGGQDLLGGCCCEVFWGMS